jgi:ligand-binding sensor domain-containing protein
MTNTGTMILFKVRNLLLVLLTFQFSACTGQVKETSVTDSIKIQANTQPLILNQSTTFPQIHTNLNGMVREFVRTMYQDKKGNYWFGTNGDGIIRYNGQILERITITEINPNFRVLEIVEDKVGNLWFGTSEGLIKYDGVKFKTFSFKEGLPGVNAEIWGLTIDKSGLIWVGSVGGVSQFDGEKFIPFSLPTSKVENAKPMLSDKLVFKIIEDRNGTMWFANDGNGIFKYNNGNFTHLTTKNGLVDNNTADILEDRQGNIWIGTFYGGVSKFDGKKFTNFTKDRIIEGEETYNFYEDSKGNIWFTAEGFGVYRYDSKNFKKITIKDGLTSNVTLSILEDKKGQVWFGSWQGLCIFDGEKFVNAKDKEPWTN